MATHVIKQLAQTRPGGTAAVSAYSPPANTETIVHNIIICNTTASTAKFSIYHDEDGTTYDATTALVLEADATKGTTTAIEVKICMGDSSGNLAVQTDTANALTFSLNGEEFTA